MTEEMLLDMEKTEGETERVTLFFQNQIKDRLATWR